MRMVMMIEIPPARRFRLGLFLLGLILGGAMVLALA
jgi:hypothetical protein